MNFFEKIGLIEREEASPSGFVAPDLPAHDVQVEAVVDSTTNIVDDVYSQNGLLSDKSNSIYTVQALIDTLPEEMTTAKKQSTVAGILAVSGRLVADLLNDAKTRMDILSAAKQKIVYERSEEISNAKADIEELKKAIEAANIKIKEAEDIISATEKSVDEEVKIIEDLVNFCSGMEDKK